MNNKARDTLVAALHDAEHFLSGEEMSARLNISRTAVWKHIQQLKKNGYHIVTMRRKGYKLLSLPRELVVGEVKRLLTTKFMGRELLFYPELDSTNNRALELARHDKTKEGVFVVARLQRQGRGRRGRSWLSLPGGIWASGILRPNFLPAQASLVTFAAAVAICEAIREQTSLNVGIKWPNDIVCDGRKLGGVLSEIESEADTIHFLVLGFGINANIRMSKFPQPLRAQATSLYRELKREVSLSELFVKILEKLEVYYIYLQEGQVEMLLDLWKKYDCTLGRDVSITRQDGRIISGFALDIDETGALIVRTSSGQKTTITSGDLVIHHQTT